MTEYYNSAQPSQAETARPLAAERDYSKHWGYEHSRLSPEGLAHPTERQRIEERTALALRRAQLGLPKLRARPSSRLAAAKAHRSAGIQCRQKPRAAIERRLDNTISDNSTSGGASGRPSWRLTTAEYMQRTGLRLRQVFPDLLPARPFCSNDPRQGLVVRAVSTALTYSHLQWNHPASVRWLIFDVDRDDAYFAAGDAMLPPPSVIMRNPKNGHAHLAYAIDMPVAKYETSRRGPIDYAAAVERGLRRRLGADRSYSGLVAKNPASEAWQVVWCREAPYSLEELAGELTQHDMRPEPVVSATAGLGRNCQIFEETRQAAYREILGFKRAGGTLPEWRRRVEEIAMNFNDKLEYPLPDMEIHHIAKSVAKWVWPRFTEEGFREVQRARVNRRWEGHEAASTTKPWTAEGISRTAYYQRKARGLINGRRDEPR